MKTLDKILKVILGCMIVLLVPILMMGALVAGDLLTGLLEPKTTALLRSVMFFTALVWDVLLIHFFCKLFNFKLGLKENDRSFF